MSGIRYFLTVCSVLNCPLTFAFFSIPSLDMLILVQHLPLLRSARSLRAGGHISRLTQKTRSSSPGRDRGLKSVQIAWNIGAQRPGPADQALVTALSAHRLLKVETAMAPFCSDQPALSLSLTCVPTLPP